MRKYYEILYLVLGVSGSSCSNSQTDEIGLKITAGAQFTDPTNIGFCKLMLELLSGRSEFPLFDKTLIYS